MLLLWICCIPILAYTHQYEKALISMLRLQFFLLRRSIEPPVFGIFIAMLLWNLKILFWMNERYAHIR